MTSELDADMALLTDELKRRQKTPFQVLNELLMSRQIIILEDEEVNLTLLVSEFRLRFLVGEFVTYYGVNECSL